MRVLNARRQAALEILTGDGSGCQGFVIVRSGGRTAGQVLCSNGSPPDDWWLLRYLHRCSGGMMEEWFRTPDDVPDIAGPHLICRSCGLIGLRIEDCP